MLQMDLNLLPSVLKLNYSIKNNKYTCSLTAVYVFEVNIVEAIHASFSFL